MGIESLVINPSINVSPYCYSILRVEPYTSCWHRCTYCFGRWYRAESIGGSIAEPNVIGDFRRTLKFLRRRDLKIIPFRLSTLVDPFQPIEREHHVSRHIMSLCLKYNVPLIINTKAILLSRGELHSILEKLSGEGLVIVQVSISTVNAEIARILEPNAPPPADRLDMVEKLSRDNIPVVMRLQPFIPGITDYEIDEIVKQSHYAGARQIIVESLRDEIENIKVYEELAYEKDAYRDLGMWVSYSPSVEVPSKIIRPSIKWRIKAYVKVKELCDKYGLEFSTCKEGFYNYHTAKNCCGMHHLENGKYLLRPTLHEAWVYYEKRGAIPKFDEIAGELADTYLFGERIRQYPRGLRKKILSHEKILREVLDERRDIIKELLPTLQI